MRANSGCVLAEFRENLAPKNGPVSVRISGTDWGKKVGWDLPQAIELCRTFQRSRWYSGVTLIERRGLWPT